MSVESDAKSRPADVRKLAERIRISPGFAGKLSVAFTPGAIIIVTDEPAIRGARCDFAIMTD